MSYFDDHNISHTDDQNDENNEQNHQLTEQQLMELLAQEYGTTNMLRMMNGTKPSTSKTVLRELEVQYYDPETSKNSDSEECPICQDDYKKGDALHTLPCKHQMHKECLKTWLDTNNSCPMCRHELMTDDPDYEEEKLDKQNPKRKQETISSMYM